MLAGVWYLHASILTHLFAYAAENTAKSSERIEELQNEIQAHGTSIAAFESAIEQYETELVEVAKEAQTLENTISGLDISIRRFTTDISLTGEKIDQADLTVEQLKIEIEEKETQIQRQAKVLAEALRTMNETESDTLVEVLLSYDNISDFLHQVISLERFQGTLKEELDALQSLRTTLTQKHLSQEVKRKELFDLKISLGQKKEVVEYTKDEKSSILKTTKNEEKNFIALLEKTRELKEAFERELLALESQLELFIDPDSIPDANQNVLAWPLEEVTVTQLFGDTAFARSNRQAYKGTGHNGVDLRAPTGTRITAALSGTVEAVGNTDAIRGCYSYGKWVLVRHNNGLSTLYAHLSVIAVNAGDVLATGDTVGYSGNSGYSTGPHLHFTVYASQGVQVTKFTKSINCKDATIPIAALDAYLNPLAYLSEPSALAL
jgi:murein DD-endopeptidase MepM/ murein hydrolase activator NlpD